MTSRGVSSDAYTATAAVVLRVVVLLQAGLAPPRAWELLAGADDPIAAAVTARVAQGERVEDAVAAQGGAWPDVALAWRIATEVGAPLAPGLRAIVEALRDAQDAADQVRVALAEPVATARLLTWLPLVAVVLGMLLGFDTAAVLVTNPLAAGAVVAGVVLMLAARRWTALLVARARPAAGVPGFDAELFAVALTAGVSIPRAEQALNAAGATVGEETLTVLALSRRSGAPAIELLRGTAALARANARVEGRMRAAHLSTRLLVPLGLCTLPAFLLLGVAPTLLGALATEPLL